MMLNVIQKRHYKHRHVIIPSQCMFVETGFPQRLNSEREAVLAVALLPASGLSDLLFRGNTFVVSDAALTFVWACILFCVDESAKDGNGKDIL